jgi:hypothetical protein
MASLDQSEIEICQTKRISSSSPTSRHEVSATKQYDAVSANPNRTSRWYSICGRALALLVLAAILLPFAILAGIAWLVASVIASVLTAIRSRVRPNSDKS